MAEEIAFEKGRISNFEGLVTLTFTVDWVILHTVMHHSSTSTYTLNIIYLFIYLKTLEYNIIQNYTIRYRN